MFDYKFVDACLTGDALLEEIDDYIDEWHESESDEDLHTYLGMSSQEYAMWVENSAILKTIIYCREKNLSIDEYLTSGNIHTLAARSSTPEEAKQMKTWLEKKGFFIK